MTENDFKKIDATINDLVESEMLYSKRKDVVSSLLYARTKLLDEFGAFKRIKLVKATPEENDKYKTDSDIYTFSGKVAVYRGERYPIFNDDYGQCDCLSIGKTTDPEESISLGTYTSSIWYKDDIPVLIENSHNCDILYSLFGKEKTDYKAD